MKDAFLGAIDKTNPSVEWIIRNGGSIEEQPSGVHRVRFSEGGPSYTIRPGKGRYHVIWDQRRERVEGPRHKPRSLKQAFDFVAYHAGYILEQLHDVCLPCLEGLHERCKWKEGLWILPAFCRCEVCARTRVPVSMITLTRVKEPNLETEEATVFSVDEANAVWRQWAREAPSLYRREPRHRLYIRIEWRDGVVYDSRDFPRSWPASQARPAFTNDGWVGIHREDEKRDALLEDRMRDVPNMPLEAWDFVRETLATHELMPPRL